ncbi:MAG TPA: TIGR04076 family protein [Spirochaetota bacterium]|nr:TIGR04076 family protein [Spirochaetota bacterium]
MEIKITVLDTMSNIELAGRYCRDGQKACPCPIFKPGQEFTTTFEKPPGFCEWAWTDIYKYIAIFLSGGNMGDAFNWMADNNSVIACCTDGIRPVIFRIEKTSA